MTDAVIVLCTFPDREKARQIGTLLVERQYAACMTFMEGAESIYRWEGKICQESEVLAIIKTTRDAFPILSRELRALHPYDEPEIISIPVTDGSPGYLGWLMDQVRA